MLRFLLGIILILGPSNLASSFSSVLPEEVKEKEKYEKNGQQSFDILLACLCIMKYWICGSCCAYHSSGRRGWTEKCPKFCVLLTFPLPRCTSSVPWLSSPCLFFGPHCPPTGFDLQNKLYPLNAHHLLLDLGYQSQFLFISIFCPSQRIYTLSIPILLPIAHMGLTGYNADHGFYL